MGRTSYLDSFLKEAKLAETTLRIDKDVFNKIIKSIDKWLLLEKQVNKKLQDFYNSWDKKDAYSTELNMMTAGGVSALIKAYETQTRQNEQAQNCLSEVEDLFKKGYELIYYIRETFTKQKILYSIAYTENTKNQPVGGQIQEVQLTLDEILSYFSLRGKAIRQNSNKSFMDNLTLKTSNAKIKRIIQELEKIHNNIDKPNLWNSLYLHAIDIGYNYLLNTRAIYASYKVLRMEDRYKTINFIGYRPGEKNTLNLGTKIIRENYRRNITGIEEGGDVANLQVKSVLKSEIALVNTSEIKPLLEEIKLVLANPNIQQMEMNLKNIFISKMSNFDTVVDEVAWAAANHGIEESMKEIKNNVINIDI